MLKKNYISKNCLEICCCLLSLLFLLEWNIFAQTKIPHPIRGNVTWDFIILYFLYISFASLLS